MGDKFGDREDHVFFQASGGINITPSDTDEFGVTKALYVGGAGDLYVTMKDGTTPVFAVQVGYHPLRVSQVLAATTATGIVALY